MIFKQFLYHDTGCAAYVISNCVEVEGDVCRFVYIAGLWVHDRGPYFSGSTKNVKLLTLPAELEIYPAHFTGSLCGAGMSGKASSTLAFEKRWNPALSLDHAAFIEKMTNGAPPKPADLEVFLHANRTSQSQ